MDESLFTPYLQLTDADRPPNVPRIRLYIEAAPRASTTLPYELYFALQRDDDDPRPCIVAWGVYLDIFLPSNLVLLRCVAGTNGPSQLEKLDVGPDPVVDQYTDFFTDSEPRWGSDSSWVEVPSGGEYRFLMGEKLPERYHKLLVAGERYELLWQGSEALGWAWGSRKEHWANKLSLSRLVIPGGSRLGFVVGEEATPWPGREEYEARMGFARANDTERAWRLEEARKLEPRGPELVMDSERVSGAPVLVVTLDCPKTLTLHKSYPGHSTFNVNIRVVYDAPPSERPVTFHTFCFNPDVLSSRSRREGYWLARDDQEWNLWDLAEEEAGAYAVYDQPDDEVRIRGDSRFVSLRPGESWTTTYELQSPIRTNLPEDVKIGNVFHYRFRGVADVDWWDWGHFDKEHAETTVTLPGHIGRVVDPTDNGGRPKLVVPASNWVEFRVVDDIA